MPNQKSCSALDPNLRSPISSNHLINHHFTASCLHANIGCIRALTFAHCRSLTLYPPPPVLLSHSNPIRLPSAHSFPTRDMTDHPGSARFQALLESAVQAYEKNAGVTLANSEYLLAVRLQHCHSVDDIATLLQGQAQAITDFQQRDRTFKSIKMTVSILSPISSIADDVGLIRWKVFMACFTSLTVFTDDTPTCNGDTRYSWYPTEGTFLSPYRYPSDIQLRAHVANFVIVVGRTRMENGHVHRKKHHGPSFGRRCMCLYGPMEIWCLSLCIGPSVNVVISQP